MVIEGGTGTGTGIGRGIGTEAEIVAAEAEAEAGVEAEAGIERIIETVTEVEVDIAHAIENDRVRVITVMIMIALTAAVTRPAHHAPTRRTHITPQHILNLTHLPHQPIFQLLHFPWLQVQLLQPRLFHPLNKQRMRASFASSRHYRCIMRQGMGMHMATQMVTPTQMALPHHLLIRLLPLPQPQPLHPPRSPAPWPALRRLRVSTLSPPPPPSSPPHTPNPSISPKRNVRRPH